MQDDHCRALVRGADRDRWLTTLFAPAEHRAGLLSLYAFNIELARVRSAAREPLAGEIRLQWWRDVIDGEGRGDVDAHPVAAALRRTIAHYGLQAGRLDAIATARRFDLYDEPMPTLAALTRYADDVAGNLILSAAQILTAGCLPEMSALAAHAGRAHAFTGLLNAVHAAPAFVPHDLMDRHGVGRDDLLHATAHARAALAELHAEARRHLTLAGTLPLPSLVLPALLPLALTGPVLVRMEHADYDPRRPVDIAAWRRQWLIWRAARRPQRLFA
ncbi:MAG: squalene/phytoene synthase family protein [Hyphomicrobiales bacterium]|nr:squalene/phytoene synthase family protein [Hyphomicrobiales bacterium]